MNRRLSMYAGVILIVSLILVLGLASISSAASLQVDNSGACDDVGGGPYCTIQAAINAAAPTDTINVAAGTYAEILNVNKSLSIIGAGSGSVTIDATAATGYHLTVNGISDVTLQGFTLNGSASASYGLKISGVDASTKSQNITVTDIVVNNTKRTGVDINGVDGVTLNNIQVNNVPSGAGVALTDCDNAIVSNITTSGNAWGGVAIYTYGRYYPGGSTNITLSNIVGDEANPLYIEVGNYNDPGTPYAVTSLTLPAEYTHSVRNDEYRDGGDNFIFYFTSEADAIAYALALHDLGADWSYVNQASVVNVLADGSFVLAPGLSIQAAIDAADPGDTVNVAAGTYTEAILVDKPLTLSGATAGLNKNGYTVPASYAWDDTVESIINHPDPSSGYTAIVDIVDTNDVTFEGFVIQEKNAEANKNTSLVRVYAHTQEISNIVVRNNIIGPNTNTTAQDGAQGRMGLYIVNHPYNDKGVVNSTFSGNKIFDSQGNGDNVFLWSSYHAYGAPGPASMSGTVIEDNEIYGANRTGIETAGGFSGLAIRNNTIYENGGPAPNDPDLKYGTGILMIRGASDKVDCDGYGPVDVTIENNEIYDNEDHGIYMGPNNKDITITGNSLHDNGEDAVRVDLIGNYWNPSFDPNPGPYTCLGGSQNISASSNYIEGNGAGVQVIGTPTNGFVFDAEKNWWGDATGPDHISNPHATPGGDSVSDNVDYLPWYATDTTTPATEYVSTTHNPVIAVSDTIQGAVDAALPGDTVSAVDGNYEEQVVIDIDLTLQGQSTSTVIQAPTTVPTCAASSYDWHAIVCVINDADVTIDTFTIDGLGRGSGNSKFMGVAFRNAGGVVTDSVIKDIREDPLNGNQHGVGINAYNDDSIARNLDVINNDIYGFQKNGMAIATGNSNELTVQIDGNDVTGAPGLTADDGDPAQNGIQVYEAGGSLTGTISNNTVDSIAYDNTNASTKWVATSILNYFADMDIDDNTITGAHMGVYDYDAEGIVQNNDITIEKIGVYAFGIIASDPPDAVPSPFIEDTFSTLPDTLEAQATTSTLEVDILNNILTFSGTDNSSTYGIEADGGFAADDLEITANGNEVSGFEVGIEVYQCTSDCGAGVFTSVTANNNCLGGNDYGIRSNASYITVDGEENNWGDDSGPYHPINNASGTGSEVSDYVDFDPWIIGSCGSSVTLGNWQNTTTGLYDDLQGSLDAAQPGETIVPVGDEPLGGGGTATQPGVTIDLNGKTVGPGSPFLTVAAADITVLGPGTLDGAGSTDPAILVVSGGDNFIMEDVEVMNWADGVEVANSVASFKLASNWIHNNTNAGLLVDPGVLFSGVVTIEGNLFKDNTGPGVDNQSGNALDVTYNSWGDNGGPTGTNGDGVSNATFTPWTFSEVYMDVDPDNEAVTHGVNEDDSFDVALKVDAVNLYGVSFSFTYDTSLITLNTTTFNPPWDGKCIDDGSGAGVISYVCNFIGTSEWTDPNGRVATLNFTADLPGIGSGDAGPWSAIFDISELETDTSTAAKGGVKVFVNNAGYGAPSVPLRDITNVNPPYADNDGEIVITGTPEYTGYIDLQGRTNDSGATLKVKDQQAISGSTDLGSGSSVSSGMYTTQYSGTPLALNGIYWFQVDAALYLPTTVTNDPVNPLPTDWAQSKALSTRPLTTLNTLVLLGGDGTDDDLIDIADAGCIGGDYGTSNNNCSGGLGADSDVNGDGVTDILDLVLMGGNFGLNASPWTP